MTIEELALGLKLPYKVRAWLQPALLAALPLALAVLVWFPKGIEGQAVLISLLSWAGIGSVVMSLARETGKAIEPALWQSWGGAPTTRLLRFRDAPNQALLSLRHEALRVLVPEVALPESAAAEAANRRAADAAYEACVSVLRSSTRDRRKFPLVFEENCSYGFRRNLLGLRRWGTAASLLGLIAAGFHARQAQEFVPLDGAAVAIMLLLIAFWWLAVRLGWVRSAAEAYADRLLQAAVDLAEEAKRARGPGPA